MNADTTRVSSRVIKSLQITTYDTVFSDAVSTSFIYLNQTSSQMEDDDDDDDDDDEAEMRMFIGARCSLPAGRSRSALLRHPSGLGSECAGVTGRAGRRPASRKTSVPRTWNTFASLIALASFWANASNGLPARPSLPPSNLHPLLPLFLPGPCLPHVWPWRDAGPERGRAAGGEGLARRTRSTSNSGNGCSLISKIELLSRPNHRQLCGDGQRVGH